MWHVWETGQAHSRFWWGNLSERDHLENLGLAGKVILKWIFKKRGGDLDWIDLDMDGWWAVVNAVMNLQVL
jgi:hypothetical protein